ncbi:MAG TPA: HIT domain-containing protein [Capsulimonadaceae bacterium]|jgi:ATP adenylyltransferase
MAYIDKSDLPKKDEHRCIFCDKAADDDDQRNLILYRGRTAFVLLNLYPYNNGHLMIAPYQHTCKLTELSDETMLEIMQLTRDAQLALKGAFAPDGYNVGINLGAIAGAGIADHMHQHIVPRWGGDSNFMHVIGDTKVMPDSLENSYRKIKEAWGRSDGG